MEKVCSHLFLSNQNNKIQLLLTKCIRLKLNLLFLPSAELRNIFESSCCFRNLKAITNITARNRINIVLPWVLAMAKTHTLSENPKNKDENKSACAFRNPIPNIEKNSFPIA